MEVTILEAHNPPAMPVLAVQAGTVRGQMKLERNRAFRLPHPGSEWERARGHGRGSLQRKGRTGRGGNRPQHWRERHPHTWSGLASQSSEG